MIFYGKTKDLQFRPDNLKAWYTWIEQHDGKNVVVNIDLEKNRRSLNQNSFYWKFLEIIANETGHHSEELHRLFKGLFLPKKIVTFKGKQYQMSGSTTELSKADFGIYLDKISAESGVPIPDPQMLADANPVAYPSEDNRTEFD